MSRNKKFSDPELLLLVDELFEKTNGDITALSYRGLAAYASKKGIPAGEHLFRGSTAVRDRIEKLRQLITSPEEQVADVFVGLDPDALLRSSSSIDELRKRLSELSAEWHRCYLSKLAVCSELHKLKEGQKDLLERYRTLERENSDLSRDLKKAKKENRLLIKQFEEYIYPNAAKKILSEKIPGITFSDYCNVRKLDNLTEELQPSMERSGEEIFSCGEALDSTSDDLINFTDTKKRRKKHY